MNEIWRKNRFKVVGNRKKNIFGDMVEVVRDEWDSVVIDTLTLDHKIALELQTPF